jgi:subtilase family serine protease
MLAVPGMAAAGMLIAVAGCGSGGVTPAATATASPPVSDCLTPAHPTCYAPRQFRVAYGIQPLLDHGINGRGQTIVLPEIAPAATATVTDVRQDLARYDSVFGLPAARLQVLTRFAGAASPYRASGEEAGDAEIVHAIAPGAAIRVILLPATLPQSGTAQIASAYAAALRLAPSLGTVVSVSAGLGERCFTSADIATVHSALQEDQDRHVTVIVSSGDFGAAIQPCPGTAASVTAPPKGVNYPASDPLVLAVGGTSLNADHATGAYLSETAWNRPITPAQGPHWASGGGFSSVFGRPADQAGVPGIGASRGVPDVAADADAYTGIAGVGVLTGGQYVISQSAGTSAGAPFWAGIVALANQYAGRDLGFINAGLYRIGQSASYHKAFHDITQGNNTVMFGQQTITGYQATPGWDPVTGWGSPDAQVLIPLLTHYISP